MLLRALLMLSVLLASLNASGTSDLAERKQALSSLLKEISAQQRTISNQTKQKNILLGLLKKNEQAIAKLAKSLNKNKKRLVTINQELAQLKKEIPRLQAQQKQQQTILSQQVKSAFMVKIRSFI